MKWLHDNNPVYSNIIIDSTRLNNLPDDDVPDELLAVIQREDDDDVAARERESYLVNEKDSVSGLKDEEMNDEGLVFLKLHISFFFDNWGIGAAHVIPIQFVGVQDCDHAKLSMNEVLLYVLANADDDRYGHEGGYAIIHGVQPVPDLPKASKSFDVLAATYPVLWPYGCGLYHEAHSQKLGFAEYI